MASETPPIAKRGVAIPTSKRRLPESAEKIIRELIERLYLPYQKHRPSLSTFHCFVAQACIAQNLQVPSRSTLARRIAAFNSVKGPRILEEHVAYLTLDGIAEVPSKVSMPVERVDVPDVVTPRPASLMDCLSIIRRKLTRADFVTRTSHYYADTLRPWIAQRVDVPDVVTPRPASLMDCLPIIRRKLTRAGFVIRTSFYYADILRPWIAQRDRLPAFLIRYNPRDTSRIWVLEPGGQYYLEIPYSPK